MSEPPTAQPVTPLEAVRSHLALCAVLVFVCIAAAVGYGLAQPGVYQAESRLAVEGASLSAQAVPGFALASQELAANYARYVNNAEEQLSLESDIGAPEDSVVEVTASPIPESNVVRIEASALSPETAVEAAEYLADDLRRTVNESSVRNEAANEALAAYTDISGQVASAEQARNAAQNAVDRVVAGVEEGNLGALRQAAAAAAAQLAILEIQQTALGERYRALVAENVGTASQLTVVQEAVSTGGDLAARLQRYGVAGAAVGGLLAVVASTLLERRRVTRRATDTTAPRVSPASTSSPVSARRSS